MYDKIGLAGTGNLGTSVGFALKKAGWSFVGVYDVKEDEAEKAAELLGCPAVGPDELARDANVILVAVSDRSIGEFYEEIKHLVKDSSLLVHFSGSLSSDVFGKARLRISAHPAQTFPHPRFEEGLFKDVYFALEGTSEAIELFKPIVKGIGGRPFLLSKENKPLYHVICVMASNLLIGLLKSAEDLGKQIGLQEEHARAIALRFAQETVGNALNENSLASALSGPVARGDVETVEENLRVLTQYPREGEVYRLLSTKLVELSLQKGLPEEEALRLKSLLKIRY